MEDVAFHSHGLSVLLQEKENERQVRERLFVPAVKINVSFMSRLFIYSLIVIVAKLRRVWLRRKNLVVDYFPRTAS